MNRVLQYVHDVLSNKDYRYKFITFDWCTLYYHKSKAVYFSKFS